MHVAMRWRVESLEVAGGLTSNWDVSQELGACESHQRKKAQRDFHL